MSKHLKLFTILALATPCFSAPLLAQGKSSVSSAELDAAVSKSPTVSKEAVRSFLTSDQVKRVAGQMGINTNELSTKVANANQSSLDLFASQAQVNDRVLAGGATSIVITTTGVIIILLILILLLR